MFLIILYYSLSFALEKCTTGPIGEYPGDAESVRQGIGQNRNPPAAIAAQIQLEGFYGIG